MRACLGSALALCLAACGAPGAQEAASTGHSGGSGGSSGTGSGAGGDAIAPGVLCADVTEGPDACTPNNYHAPLTDFVAGSSLVFRGTVKALHATTAGIELQDKSRLVVAHVDEVLFEGGILELTGQDVTVQLLAEPTMAVGYEGYFFSASWLAGQTVAVTEVAHVDPGVYPDLETAVPGIEALLADQRLFGRMETAGAVVVGKVTAVTPLPQAGPSSEHEPVWAEATIDVECTLRGTKPASARVAFATSFDVAWAHSPKLTAGQTGVFLLQPVPSPPGLWPIPDSVPHVVYDTRDVLPIDERPHVATLVRCPPGE